MTKNEKLVNRFAIILSFLTIVLISIGSLVTSTNSGLAVPDWPNTYGENMFLFPPSKWIGGIFYEHFHRLVASAIGFLTIILTILLYKFEKQKFVKKLGITALALVILQGVLGGLTVLFLLPQAISVFHATIAQTFLSVLILISFFTSNYYKSNQLTIKKNNENRLLKLSFFSFGAVYLQLIFGAIMRHYKSGLASIDWPLMYGKIFPNIDEQSVLIYNQTLIEKNAKLFSDNFLTRDQLIFHFIHRTWAFVVVILILTMIYNILKNKNLSSSIKKFSLTLNYIIFLQFILGILTVFTFKNFIIASLHVTFGAVTLSLTLVILLQIWKSKNSEFIKL